MKDHETILASRAVIDERLDALENFSFNVDGAITDDEIDALISLVCRFHLGRDNLMRYASLEQAERLKRSLPKFLIELVPQVAKHWPESLGARFLIEGVLSSFIANIEKLDRTRKKQSESGRGAFGRETLAKLRERNAQLEAENAELRAV